MRQLSRCKALNVFFLYDSIIVKDLKKVFFLTFNFFLPINFVILGKKNYFSLIKEKIGGKKKLGKKKSKISLFALGTFRGKNPTLKTRAPENASYSWAFSRALVLG
jgi:surface polysaccharide O-acyltransferase-like enzyme